MKNLKTKFLASVLLASLFLTALACEEETAPSMPPNDPPPKGAMGDGPKGDGPKGPGGKMGDGNPMERVQKEMISEGSMTVCTDAPYEPFEFQDEDGNSALIKAIQKENTNIAEMLIENGACMWMEKRNLTR